MIELLWPFVITTVGVGATVATLPSAIELFLVTSGSALRRSPALAANADNFALAIVVPAHNEEALIGRCVKSLLSSAVAIPSCKVVVVADNCTDATAERAREAGAVVLVRSNLSQRGKGYALRFAFDFLAGQTLDGFLVVDADSIVSANLIPEVVGTLKAGADALQTRYRVARPLDTDRKRLMDVALLAFNVLRPKGRDAWGLSAGILGNGFALSRKTLRAVPYSADSIVEDLEYHLLLVTAGRKVQFLNSATVYGDMPSDAGAQLSQRARWEGGRARVAIAWIPRLAGRLFRGKLSLLEPLLELLTLPLAYVSVLAILLSALPNLAFRFYGLFLLFLLLAHVASSVAIGGNIRESIAALAAAPGYIFWKVIRMGAILRSSRSDAQWLRTPRASDTKTEAPHVR